MTAVNYLWNPINDNIVEEFDDMGNTITEYTTEPDQFGDVISQYRDGQESFYHTDSQGSTLALTNAAGDVTDTYAYSAFGEVTAHTGSTVNPFQYIGQKGYYRDQETGEHEVRRRVYQSLSARWYSKDPHDTDELLNKYTYGNLDPLNVIDPSGLAPDYRLKRECTVKWALKSKAWQAVAFGPSNEVTERLTLETTDGCDAFDYQSSPFQKFKLTWSGYVEGLVYLKGFWKDNPNCPNCKMKCYKKVSMVYWRASKLAWSLTPMKSTWLAGGFWAVKKALNQYWGIILMSQITTEQCADGSGSCSFTSGTVRDNNDWEYSTSDTFEKSQHEQDLGMLKASMTSH